MEKLIIRRLKMRLNDPFTTSFGTMQEKEFFISEIVDRNGNRGFGESVAFTAPWYSEESVETNRHIIEDFLIDLLRENKVEHPDDVLKIFSSIRGNNMAKSTLEGAVWDLYAKREDVSLAKLLGGEKNRIDVGISIGIQSTVEDLLQTIEYYVREGYKRIKLKIKPGWDLDVLREVRKKFPETPIMADANSAYTLDDLDHLKKLDDYNLMMIEQPLAHDDIIDHAKLQNEMETPICLDESIHSLSDAKKAVELGSCKIINIKIGRVGGISEAKRIHDFCKEQGVDAWCGGMLEAGVGRAHNIALTTLPQFTMPGDTAGSSRYWEKDIIKPEVVVQDGVIHVPNKPGIGYEIDDNALETYTIEKKEYKL